MTSKRTPLISLSAVYKTFPGGTVLDNLDLDIEDGEFFTLLGPSGCGKTTLLRILAGLESCTSGSLLLEGQDQTQVPPEKRHVNTVFQSYALFPHMTVFDNVAFGLRMQQPKVAEAEIKQRVEAILNKVKMTQFINRFPHQMSGGQQQRIAIARAVVNEPKVLLLDEPLSALDYKLRRQMQSELKKLQRNLGITFVFVTHDQEEALSMSDRIAVMDGGKIQQLGTPREIYEEPANLFVAKFIGEINIFDAVLGERQSDGKIDAIIDGYPCHVDDQGRFATGDKVHILLRPEDLRVYDIKDDSHDNLLTGEVVERNYQGATLDSLIRLQNGHEIWASEFFDEDDPDFDYKLGERVAVSWVPSWEVVLPYEPAHD